MQYDEAAAAFTRAISINPKGVDAYVGRGDAFYDKGDGKKALADYNKAEELDFSLSGDIEAKKKKISITALPSAGRQDSVPTSTPETWTDEKALQEYRPILREYQNAYSNGLYNMEQFPDISQFVLRSIFDGDVSNTKLVYTLIDFADDGVPELVVSLDDEADSVLDIFNSVDGKVQRLGDTKFESGYDSAVQLDKNNIIQVETRGGPYIYNYYRVEADSKEDYDSAISQYQERKDIQWTELKGF